MRVGIYGGTFNPPHWGHLTAAAAAFRALDLDELLVLPAAVPPHKSLPEGSASVEDRLEMARLAVGYLGLKDQAKVLDLEARRQGKSYTSDTLRELKKQYPEDELWLLMGTDMFLSLLTWHEAEAVLRLAHIAVFGREEEDTEALFRPQQELLREKYGTQTAVVINPDVIEISSTELRATLGRGEGQRYLPPAVYGYVQLHGLYGTSTDLKHLTPDALRPIALSYLKHKRIRHVLGTEEEAVRLARRYGVDETAARTAALLHDCTKKLTMEEQLALCQTYAVPLDELERNALKLLHAKTGAEIARDVFGIAPEVYEAIRWHTTGKADMTTLEKVIYLADYIEPTRDFPGVEELRRLCYEDLDKGLLLGLTMTVQEMQAEGNPVHYQTAAARDFLLRQRTEKKGSHL